MDDYIRLFHKIKYSKHLPTIIYDNDLRIFVCIEKISKSSERDVIKTDISKESYVYKKPSEEDAKEIKKIIFLLLNKITKTNIKETITIIKEKMINDDVKHYVLSCIFNQAIQQSMFCELYVELFKMLSKQYKKEIILIINEKQKMLLSDYEENKAYDDDYDSFCSYLKNKELYKNIYNFMTLMYQEKLITKKIFNEYLKVLFDNLNKNISDNELRSIFLESIKTIFTLIRDEKIYAKYKTKINNTLNYLSENKKMREKFILLDIIEKYK